ncbi:MAG: TetR/AcrR family transcriptional regulator [Alphaproteobacteria bacterium]|nr:TetR/AcrR family transcriptional regulator [Alphaproteobacteria bacterium]
MTDKTDTRQLILDAAVERIMHYGYAKTTMAEIARDCDMSAGNIYRFFASKIDIAEAMARKLNIEINQQNAALARGPGTAGEKLLRFHQHALRTTFEKLDKDAKVLEVAEILSHERPTFANEELAQERVHLVEILEQGIASGEFMAMKNPNFIAEMMQAATMKFRLSAIVEPAHLAKLERELKGVMALVLAGLSVPIDVDDAVNSE